MKKILHTVCLVMMLVIALSSCMKEVHQSEIIREITIDTTIEAGSDFLLNLAPYGKDDDMATLLERGNYFSLSQLENNNDLFTSVYHYASSLKTSGKDRVVLAISENPDARPHCSKDSTIITLNFTIR